MIARKAVSAEAPPVPTRHPPVRLATTEEEFRASPVADLQAQIVTTFQEPEHIDRWPLAVSIPLMVLASAALWLGIVALARVFA
jgi:hypothetical protein